MTFWLPIRCCAVVYNMASRPRRRVTIGRTGDVLRDALRVPAHAVDHRRRRREHERQAHEVEPWLARDDARFVERLAVVVEDR